MDSNPLNPIENLLNFSSYLGEKFHFPPTMLSEHLFCSISLALSHTETLRQAVNQIYFENPVDYNKAYESSPCKNHNIMSQGTIETELTAHRVLGIVLTAEYKPAIRKKVLDLMKTQYSAIYKFAKKHDEKYLKPFYEMTEIFLNAPEAKYDRAVYFYLCFYCSPNLVEQNNLNIIAQNIYNFETYSPLFADIKEELKKEARTINRLKGKVEKKYGNLTSYLKVLEHPSIDIHMLGGVIENLFHINKLNMDDIYGTYTAHSLDTVYLSAAKQPDYIFPPEQLTYAIITGIFLEPLILEYKKAKSLIKTFHTDTLELQLASEREHNKSLTQEKEQLLIELNCLQAEKNTLLKQIYETENQENKEFKAEITGLNQKVKELEKELKEEKNYRLELNKLREYIFNLDNTPSMPTEHNLALGDLLEGKNIIILGGPKQWRRKLREEYPVLKTLSGTSTSFDVTILNHADCVLFYTGYMSHAFYNKVMNHIRSNEITFGYLKTTNLSLLEGELYEVLKQCKIIPF